MNYFLHCCMLNHLLCWLQHLEKHGVPIPSYALVNRYTPYENIDYFIEEEDFISVKGKRMFKPFVEKPVDGKNLFYNMRLPWMSDSSKMWKDHFQDFPCLLIRILILHCHFRFASWVSYVRVGVWSANVNYVLCRWKSQRKNILSKCSWRRHEGTISQGEPPGFFQWFFPQTYCYLRCSFLFKQFYVVNRLVIVPVNSNPK